MNRWLALTLKLLVSGTLLFLLFRRIEGQQLHVLLRRANVGLIGLAVSMYILGQILCAYRWKLLLDAVGFDLPLIRAVSLYFLGMFFNLFFPTMVGGDAVKVYYLTREFGDIPRSTTTVLMDRDAGLGALLLVAVVVSGVADVQFLDVPMFPFLVGMFAAFGVANLLLFYDPTYRLLAQRFERLRWTGLTELTRRLHAAFSAYRRSLGRLLGAVGLSLLFDMALIGFAYLAARAIGWPVAFKYFCVFIPLIALVSMVPITVYGFGLREYAFVFFFSRVGMSEEASLLLSFLFFFIVLVSSLPGAVVYIFYRRRPSS